MMGKIAQSHELKVVVPADTLNIYSKDRVELSDGMINNYANDYVHKCAGNNEEVGIERKMRSYISLRQALGTV